MSRPEDIPQDVWEAATNAAAFGHGAAPSAKVSIIARAILAERERCEYFAMLWRNGLGSGRNIATQIRLGTKSPITLSGAAQ